MTVNKIRRMLIILNVFIYIGLVIIGAITGQIYASLFALCAAALWAVSLYYFDEYDMKRNY